MLGRLLPLRHKYDTATVADAPPDGADYSDELSVTTVTVLGAAPF